MKTQTQPFADLYNAAQRTRFYDHKAVRSGGNGYMIFIFRNRLTGH
jgi:hypothetical protein